MKISESMKEIRKIRDENSLRHLNMTQEELLKEFSESTKRFAKAIGKNVEDIVVRRPKQHKILKVEGSRLTIVTPK